MNNYEIKSKEKETILRLDKFVKQYQIEINQIIDAGAFDLTESLDLAQLYNAKVLAFECNPHALKLCKKKKNNSITLIKKCINLYEGSCGFYPINRNKTKTTHKDGNPGASSMFVANDKYTIETYVQDEITVPCCRIDAVLEKHNIKKVNLLWMDVQGAALIALLSMGKYLWGVDIIVVELEMKPMYQNQHLFHDVNWYLSNNHFLVSGDRNVEWFDNFIYVNKKYEKDNN